jgi:hypothetical protein
MYGRRFGDETEEVDRPAKTKPAVSMTKLRVAMLVSGLVFLWLVGVFARQVGEAQTAANQAEQMRVRNEAMKRDIQSLEAELKIVEQPAFVSLIARGYSLGAPNEIPFSVDPSAPALASDAPGTAGIRPTTTETSSSPFDQWLRVLFGS